MDYYDSIWKLFDSVLQDETERKIMKLIIKNKNHTEIIEEILDISGEV